MMNGRCRVILLWYRLWIACFFFVEMWSSDLCGKCRIVNSIPNQKSTSTHLNVINISDYLVQFNWLKKKQQKNSCFRPKLFYFIHFKSKSDKMIHIFGYIHKFVYFYPIQVLFFAFLCEDTLCLKKNWASQTTEHNTCATMGIYGSSEMMQKRPKCFLDLPKKSHNKSEPLLERDTHTSSYMFHPTRAHTH